MHGTSPLRFESFPHWVRVPGAIMLAVGLLLMVFSRLTVVLMFIVGLVLSTLGLVATFGRWVLVVDPGHRRVFDVVGLIIPMFEIRTRVFDEFNGVTLQLRVTTSDNAANVQYCVALSSPSRTRVITGEESFLAARQTAERVAKMLGLGVLDQATLSGYREPGSLDVSLRQRLLHSAALPPLGPLPERFALLPSSGGLSLRLPKAPLWRQLGNSGRWLLLASAAQVITVIRLAGMTHPRVANDPAMIWMANGFSVAGAAVGAAALYVLLRDVLAAERDTVVHASPHGLRIELHGPLRARTVTMDSTALETLGVGRRMTLVTFPSVGPERIVAAADQFVVTFGIGCAPAERTWLIHAIWHALVSDRAVRR